VLQHHELHTVVEFGAGSGRLAAQVLGELDQLGCAPRQYAIVEVSGALKHRQLDTLRHAVPHLFERVQWWPALPETFEAVVIGNEVLDAMPVKLLHKHANGWMERGVAQEGDDLVFADRATTLLPPAPEAQALPMGTVTEIHPQALGFVRTLADRLSRGVALFIDYRFPQHEYYHPQRHMGTLMCHRAHQADANPLVDVGLKDITAHVNFTGIVLAAQEQALPAGQEWQLLGYTTQAHFLINCGMAQAMEQVPLAERAMAAKLLMEHEMGELFQVLLLGKGQPWEAVGFAQGDRSHRR